MNSTDESGINLDQSALSLTTEILSSSMKNSIDAASEAQVGYNKKNNITQDQYSQSVQDFGEAKLSNSVVELKGTTYAKTTLDKLLDSDNPAKYKDAVITFLNKNKVPTSYIRFEEFKPAFYQRPFGGQEKLIINLVDDSGNTIKSFEIDKSMDLQVKVNMLEQMSMDIKKSGLGSKQSSTSSLIGDVNTSSYNTN